MQIDWGDGDYGRTAAELWPAAIEVVERAGVHAGQRVLDLGCGTGNGCLAAATHGAHVLGVEPSDALRAIARERLDDAGIEADLLPGAGEDIPLPDDSVDVVVSVFAVVFGPDPAAAAHEMARVTRPGGVVALSAWLEEGAIAATGSALRRRMPAPPPDAPTRRWSETEWTTSLLGDAGLSDVEISPPVPIVFEAASPEGFFAELEGHHPVWRSVRSNLDEAEWRDLRTESITALREANEDPATFRATSRYVVARAVA